jgi:hypothetical protein
MQNTCIRGCWDDALVVILVCHAGFIRANVTCRGRALSGVCDVLRDRVVCDVLCDRVVGLGKMCMCGGCGVMWCMFGLQWLWWGMSQGCVMFVHACSDVSCGKAWCRPTCTARVQQSTQQHMHACTTAAAHKCAHTCNSILQNQTVVHRAIQSVKTNQI